MRARSVISEAGRNLACGTSKPLLFALLVAVLSGVLAVADVSAIARVDAAAVRFQAAAASMRGIAAERRIDAASCDALARLSTIAASGALSTGEVLRLDAAPMTQFHTYRVSPGFGSLLGVGGATTDGVWVEAELAAALGLQAGMTVPTERGDLTVAALYRWPNDGRDARLGFSILIPESASEPFDECWMSSWPVLPSNDDLLLSTAYVIPGSNAALQVVPLNKNLGRDYDANAEFTSRVTSEARWFALLAGVALAVVAVSRRRMEYAAALHAGQDRTSQLLTVLLETLVWAGAGALTGTVTCLLAARLSGVTDWYTTWLVTVRCPVLAFIGALLGSAGAILCIKERLLFRYFRNR
ncbi:MAG: hypothetical protein LBH11_02295 [Propionibacteriaceae bacterium]|jgi:hypothetical protein|nr:hypothetical protein [Propionibacteriaceae bacterium]